MEVDGMGRWVSVKMVGLCGGGRYMKVVCGESGVHRGVGGVVWQCVCGELVDMVGGGCVLTTAWCWS